MTIIVINPVEPIKSGLVAATRKKLKYAAVKENLVTTPYLPIRYLECHSINKGIRKRTSKRVVGSNP